MIYLGPCFSTRVLWIEYSEVTKTRVPLSLLLQKFHTLANVRMFERINTLVTTIFKIRRSLFWLLFKNIRIFVNFSFYKSNKIFQFGTWSLPPPPPPCHPIEITVRFFACTCTFKKYRSALSGHRLSCLDLIEPF